MESSASNGGLQKLLKQLKLLVRQTEDGIKSMEGFDSGLPPKLASCISAIKQAVTQTVLSSGAANVDAQQVAKVARAEANKLWACAEEARNSLGLAAGIWDLSAPMRATLSEDQLGGESNKFRPVLACLAQTACDLHALSFGGQDTLHNPVGQRVHGKLLLSKERLQMCMFMGREWVALDQLEKAEVALSESQKCMKIALEQSSTLSDQSEPERGVDPGAEREQILVLTHDLLLLRTQVLWRLGQHALALQMAADCVALLQDKIQEHSMQLAAVMCAEMGAALADLVQTTLQPSDVAGAAATLSNRPEHAAGVEMLKRALTVVSHGMACHKSVSQMQQTEKEGPALSVDTAVQTDTTGKLLEQLQVKILTWLAFSHLLRGDGTAVLRYVDGICSVQPDAAAQPPLMAIKFKALLISGKREEAEEQIFQLAQNSAASLELCIECMELLMSGDSNDEAAATNSSVGGGRTQPLQLLPTLHALAKRMPEVQAVAATMFLLRAHRACEQQAAGDESWEALLMQTLVPASASAANASAAQDGSSFCSQLLSHLQHMEQASESVAATPDAAAHNTGIQDRAAQALTARKVLRELLWARAAHHFERRNFQSARLFYQACLAYGSTNDHSFEAHKACALCSLALQQLDRAWEHLEAAGEASSGKGGAPTAVLFMRFKVCLQRGDAATASQQLVGLQACPDYSPAILEAVCMEATKAGMHQVACDALAALHKALMESPGGCGSGHCEGDVLRVLVVCTELAAQSAAQARQDLGEPAPAPAAHHDRMARLYSTIHKRLDTAGVAGFFGDKSGTPAAVSALEWFASKAWQAATAAGNDKCYQSCAVMYVACGALLAHHPSPTAKHLKHRQMALGMAAVAALEVHMEHPTYTASLDLARRMINGSKEVAAQISQLGGGDAATHGGGPVDVLMVFHELMVALRQRDDSHLSHLLHQVVPRLPPHAQPTPQQLLMLGGLTKGGAEYPLPDCSRQLHSLALQQLARQSPTDAALMARVACELVQLASTDQEKLAVLQEAVQLMGSVASQVAGEATAAAAAEGETGPEPAQEAGEAARRGCFPARLVEWLVAVSWNRGAHHARFLRPDEAAPFMRCAMDLLPLAPAGFAAAHASMMEAQLQVQRQTGGNNKSTGQAEVGSLVT